MQGKEAYMDNDFDPRLVDAAWDEMKTMLDDELPVGNVVEEPRFHKRQLLLLLLLIGLSSGMMWHYFYENIREANDNVLLEDAEEKGLTAPASVVEQAFIAKKSEHKTPLVQTDIKGTADTPVGSIVKKAKESLAKNSFSKTNKYTRKDKFPLENKPATPLAFSGERKTTAVSSVGNKNKLQSPNTISDVQSSEKIITSDERVAPVDSKSMLGAIAKIPMLEAHLPFNRDEEISMYTAPEKLSLLQRLIPDKIGLEMGLFSANLNGFNAWKVGLGLAYKLGPRIELRTGLNVEQYQKHIAYAYSEDIDDLAASSFGEPAYAIEQSDPFNNSSYFDPDNNTENLVLKTKYYQLDKIQYISLPVVVSLSPSRFWSVNLGARFARAGKIQGTVLSGNVDQESDFVNILLKEALRKINTSIITGLTVRPHKNMGLNLNYNFAIGDIIKEDRLRVTDGSNLNNNVEVSVNWYLFGR